MALHYFQNLIVTENWLHMNIICSDTAGVPASRVFSFAHGEFRSEKVTDEQ